MPKEVILLGYTDDGTVTIMVKGVSYVYQTSPFVIKTFIRFLKNCKSGFTALNYLKKRSDCLGSCHDILKEKIKDD